LNAEEIDESAVDGGNYAREDEADELVDDEHECDRRPSCVKMLVQLQAADTTVPDPAKQLADKLGAMGFCTPTLTAAAIAAHGLCLEQCATSLACLTCDWAEALQDLFEMGFEDKEANAKMLIKHSGNVNRCVRDLMAA